MSAELVYALRKLQLPGGRVLMNRNRVGRWLYRYRMWFLAVFACFVALFVALLLMLGLYLLMGGHD